MSPNEVDELRKLARRMLEILNGEAKRAAPPSAQSDRPSVTIKKLDQLIEKDDHHDFPALKLTCQCGSVLKVKKNRTTGQRFFACPRYPQCTGSMNLLTALNKAERAGQCLCTAEFMVEECPVGRRRGNHEPSHLTTVERLTTRPLPADAPYPSEHRDEDDLPPF